MSFTDRLALARADDLTLGAFLERLARVRPDRLLASEPDRWSISVGQAAIEVAAAARTLSGRMEPGEQVLVALPNGYRLFLAVLAVNRAGGVAVPVNPKMAADEIDFLASDAGASQRIDDWSSLTSPGSAPHDPTPLPSVDPRGTAVIFYTSGTTGRPKGAELTHRALLNSAGGASMFVPGGLVHRGCVTSLPVAHIAGFSLLVRLAALGVPVHLVPKFRPTDVMDRIEATRAMMFVGVPAMFRMMEEAGAPERDLTSVKVWTSAADALPDGLAERFQTYGSTTTLPWGTRVKATFIDGYGMVELGGGVATRVLAPFDLPGTGALRPSGRNEVRILDGAGNEVPNGEVGELAVRGPGTMRGYHKQEEGADRTLDADGWLRTGDLARLTGRGSFALAGRMKDVIKHGGYSVFAREVERVLEEHPDVAEAAVLGRPDHRKGEVPVAAVRAVPGHTIDVDALVRHTASRLSDYKVPHQIVVVDDFPRTGTDKVAKRALLERFDPDPT
jgi:long-chain acyl-CoA synthetase